MFGNWLIFLSVTATTVLHGKLTLLSWQPRSIPRWNFHQPLVIVKIVLLNCFLWSFITKVLFNQTRFVSWPSFVNRVNSNWRCSTIGRNDKIQKAFHLTHLTMSICPSVCVTNFYNCLSTGWLNSSRKLFVPIWEKKKK